MGYCCPSLGQHAQWCELLVRTDPDAPKHRGITCLLVDMSTPGITVRPLTTITGSHDFNEVFFDDVRVPVSSTLGPPNEGWRVAMTTLTHERGGVAKLHLGLRASAFILGAPGAVPRISLCPSQCTPTGSTRGVPSVHV